MQWLVDERQEISGRRYPIGYTANWYASTINVLPRSKQPNPPRAFEPFVNDLRDEV